MDIPLAIYLSSFILSTFGIIYIIHRVGEDIKLSDLAVILIISAIPFLNLVFLVGMFVEYNNINFNLDIVVVRGRKKNENPK